jgi:hypothetical protein
MATSPQSFQNEIMETSPPSQTHRNPEGGQTMIQITESVPKPQLWKLFKSKCVLIFYLCGDCHNRLYHSKDRIVESPEQWTVKFDLCATCVYKNCQATTNLTKPYVPPANPEQQNAPVSNVQ